MRLTSSPPLRSHFAFPQPAVGSEGQAQHVAMAHRVMVPADALALVGHVDDLAEVAARVLRRVDLMPLAATTEHRPVGAKAMRCRIMTVARDLRRLPPDDLEALDARLRPGRGSGARSRAPRRWCRSARLGEAQVDALVAGEAGMRDDIAEAALARDLTAGTPATSCLRPVAVSISHSLPPFSVTSAMLGQRHAASRAGSPSPRGDSKRGDLRLGERPLGRIAGRTIAIGDAPQAARARTAAALH